MDENEPDNLRHVRTRQQQLDAEAALRRARRWEGHALAGRVVAAASGQLVVDVGRGVLIALDISRHLAGASAAVGALIDVDSHGRLRLREHSRAITPPGVER